MAARKKSVRKAAAKKAPARKQARPSTRKPAARKKAAGPRISALAASRAVKQYAEEQKIQVELTPEQLEAIMGPWDDMDPKKAAQITFVVKGKPVSQFAVAAYRYRGDTCCV